VNEAASIEDRYLDQCYTLSGRLIDPIRGSVSYNNESTPLIRRHLEVLACLASAKETMVTRRALIDLIWNGNALVGDTGLTNAIYYLRRALHDTDADNPLIRTIPRRGYLLTVEARLIDHRATAAFSAGSPVVGKPEWHLLRQLDSNPVSETWLAQTHDTEAHDTPAQRVFRFCRSEQHLRLLKRETTVMRYLREALAGRKDIAAILDWQLDEPPYFLELDYAPHGSLPQWAASQGGLRRIALAERMRLTGEVAGALAAVHAADVVHRNVSAASIFIDSDHDNDHGNDRVHARLGEFGWSDLSDRTRLDALEITRAGLTLIGDEGIGEQSYLAPECQAGQAATTASDVYALGVLLLQMVVGDLQRIASTDWERDVDSKPLRDLIAACTDAQAEHRPSAAAVSEQLRACNAVSDQSTPDVEASDNLPPAPAPAPAPAAAANPPASMIGQTIGPYHILDQLGEGGMGLVYLAEQTEPVKRRVALKLIKAGMDSKQVLARFEAERQALALMNHANVATVYDAGSTALQQPYFAMEYVRGVDIAAHCDQLALDFRERITLFLQACEGVLHAHQKGLIHRDLKPGNILVSRAQDQPATVKIIDFGVAKSLSVVLTGHAAHTRLGSFVGTPAYTSPEQMSGPLVNVDTRTDIYSLGVVLYQLLAGVTPYSEEELNRKTQAELARLLSGERPPSLLARFSSLSGDEEGEIAKHRSLSVEQMKALLGSDLSWIVGKCLQSDPDDRYPSVLELEKDLRRWLDDQPVEARPASRMYRVRKFVRRHRAGVALASVMTLGMLTTTAAAVVGFVRAEGALKAAREATAEAEMAADFQVKRLQSMDPAALGLSFRSALIEEVQKQGAGREGDPATAAQRRQQLENLLKGVNMTDLALNQLDTHSFQPALATIKKDFGDSPLLQARLWQTMADTFVKLGQYEAAVEPQRLALEQRLRWLGADDPSTLVALYGRGELGCEMTQYKEAEVDLRTATAGLRRVLGGDHPDTLRSITATGYCLIYQGKPDMALPLFREAYERRRRTLGNDHRDTLVSARDLASALTTIGKHKEALPYAEASMNGFRRVLGSVLASRDHEMLRAEGMLSSVYGGLGRFAEAETLSRKAVEAGRQVWGDKHPETAVLISNLAYALMGLDRPAEAEVYYRQALESRRAVLGDENEDVLFNRANIANALAKQGKKSEAESMLRGVIAHHRRLFGEDHINTSDLTFYLALVLRDQGKFGEAETLLAPVLATWRRVYGNENRYTLQAMNALAGVLRRKGEISAAKSLLQDALKIQRRTLGNLDEDTLQSIAELAAVARAESDRGRAETLLREALAGYRQMRGNEHVDTLNTIELLIDLLRENGALDEAAALELELKKARQRASIAKK
jgi:serine/threonine protein kinase/DNA-binding winged helix-turn-helix (wHTH) protein/tetratricopeptide (TPR) repeat protein